LGIPGAEILSRVQDVAMPNLIVDRYMKADTAFAALHQGMSPGVPRSEEEWAVYREWADATADYLLLVEPERAIAERPSEIDRIRKILRNR
jgi:hypothetical protein